MEYEDMSFLLHALQQGETFIDVGANAGTFTILASKVVGAKTIAFEPLQETAGKLKDQLAINRIEDIVDFRNLGVGNKNGTLFFTNDRDAVNKVSLAGPVPGTSEIRVTTLDDALPGNDPYFIKVDVEGFEFAVLEGALRTLASGHVSAVIIELNGSGKEFGHSNEEIHEKLLGFGFTPIAYAPKTRTLIELNGYNTGNLNTIYVRDVGLMAERCKSAPKHVVHTAFGMEI